MQINSLRTSLFHKGNDLMNFIIRHVSSLEEKDIVVITSKIVALSQGCVGHVRDKEMIIKASCEEIIDTPWAFLTYQNNEWGINAGVDESNADNELILLPQHVFTTAEEIQKKLCKTFSLKYLGVLITDTRSIPLRIGTVGRPIGFAGFHPIKSYIGENDLYGRKSRITQSNLVDALAAAAVLTMGEGAERCPLAIITDAPVIFTSTQLPKKKHILSLSPEEDIYARLYASSALRTSVHQKKSRQK